MKDHENSKELYELDLTLKQVKDIFSGKDASKEEVNEILIHFKSNKRHFIQMMNCLDISSENELIIDFK